MSSLVLMTRDRESLDLIRQALANLRFGEVCIAVHDGKVVQIARTEKLRPPPQPRDDEE